MKPKIKRFLKLVAGESFLSIYRDVRAGKQNLYLCDPITATLILAVAVGAGAAGVTAMTGGFDKSHESGGASAYTPPAADVTNTGAVADVGSVETQAAQRRLARLTRYFTTPSGVLNDATGSTGVF